ncbi:hypothetical protein [Komagataeibacter medellinensis]|nr:hypothetical protein [Komagataeibacter medellinensis]
MNMADCPPFLKPRLRLFLSADIVGSTSLKQTRMNVGAYDRHARQGPHWFSAIQGFYFEATQAFISEWTSRRDASANGERLYGEPPVFWKSVGDEVLFTKILTDYQQLATTLHCWIEAAVRMRTFLKAENPALDVKCTAWTAGFPFLNREVVLGNLKNGGDQIEDYYIASGELLNEYYRGKGGKPVSIDYIGPSIDTGFRITSFSSGRKMVLSIDAVYLLSMTNFDGEIARIDLRYEGSFPLKGVIGGAGYPIFWINMGAQDSLGVKEDRLKDERPCNREDIKEYCDAFYREHAHFLFRPFIRDDPNHIVSLRPVWYDDYHEKLIKNFLRSPPEYNNDDGEQATEPASSLTRSEIEEFVSEIVMRCGASRMPVKPDH